MRTLADERDLTAYRQRARRWLGGHEPPVAAGERAAADEHAAARDWQRMLYEGGWIGIHWPREYGGQGLSVHHSVIFSEELVRARAPHPAGVIGLEVVGPTILRYGSEEQRERFLRPLLSGEELWCQGFSEPDAGSDLAGLRTSAAPDGDHLVINGQKIWTSWATDADFCAVLARMDPDKPRHLGIGYILVDLKSPGISVLPITQLTGDPEFNEIFFSDVRVPREQVLGGPGDGWRMAMDTLGHERSGYAFRRGMENRTAFWDLVGSAREALARDAGPETKRLIGEAFVDMQASAANAKSTVRRLIAGDVPSPLDSVDKLMLTRTEQQLFAAAAELLGPLVAVPAASAEGRKAERWTKGLLYGRSASVYGGSSQIQRTLIAERLLGLPKAR